MKIISSYGVEVRNKDRNKIFLQTIDIYNKAVTFCIETFEAEWEKLSELEGKLRNNAGENLIHSTKGNKAKYKDFDRIFYKFPSYMRRSAVQEALGYLSSYYSNVENWHKDGEKGRKPTLQKHLNKMPTFYKGNMYQETKEKNIVQLKLYIDNDWKFVDIKLKNTDLKYIEKHCKEEKMSVPVLEKRNKKWFLRFTFTKEVKLKKETKEKTILSIDMGINTDATCTVMKTDGTIFARKFINYASNKDHMYHGLNKIKKISKKSGSCNTKRLWKEVKRENEELSRKIAKAITEYAKEMKVDVIVFEYLDTKGNKTRFKKQKLHMWRKNTIQKIVENKAHKEGIRISRICARNTSKLAYDGSGEVIRNVKNYKLCEFSTGKIYNCDLSASYNIGARYIIREIKKTSSAKKWSHIVAKVPECERRTQCTYATLLEMVKVA